MLDPAVDPFADALADFAVRAAREDVAVERVQLEGNPYGRPFIVQGPLGPIEVDGGSGATQRRSAGSAGSRFKDQFFTTVVNWIQLTGVPPAKLGFSTKVYLALADELGIDDPSAPTRITYATTNLPTYRLSEPIDPTERRYAVKQVRVGPSFVWHGFGAEILVEEVP